MEPIHILVIDPEQTTREQIRTALDFEGGVSIHLTSSAEGAAEVVPRHRNWALIVLNAWLPGGDAFSFIHEWKKRDARTQFILLGQDGTKTEIVQALREGVLDYFERPFAVSDLKRAAENALHKYMGLAQVIPFPKRESELDSSVVEHAVVGGGAQIRVLPAPAGSGEAIAQLGSSTGGSYTTLKKRWIESFEVDYLSQLLNQHSGNVSAAARDARLDRSNFLRLLRKYGLKAESYRHKLAA